MGWDLHIPIDRFFFDLDAICSSIIPSDIYETKIFQQTLLPFLRLKMGFNPFSVLRFFIGADAQVYVPYLYDDGDYKESYSIDIPVYENETAHIVPKLFAGIQLF